MLLLAVGEQQHVDGERERDDERDEHDRPEDHLTIQACRARSAKKTAQAVKKRRRASRITG